VTIPLLGDVCKEVKINNTKNVLRNCLTPVTILLLGDVCKEVK
jgi:hypothetical protein